MHIILVFIHVCMMIISMTLMATAVGMGMIGKSSAAKVASAGFVSTIVGTISGGVLLLGAPLSLQCAILTAYLLGTTLLYRYGFALGNVTNARLIRTVTTKS